MPKNNTVLVTGNTGFVGSHLALSLMHNGYRVIGFSQRGRKPFNSSAYAPSRFIQTVGDIRNKKILKTLFHTYEPSVCFHLAGTSTVEEGQKLPQDTYDTNINGALNILELSREHEVRKLIIASTVHVYGNNPNTPYKEECFPQPSRPYEMSKTCVDLIAQSYAHTFRMPIDIPRFVNIYGPGDNNFTRIIPKIIRQILLSGTVTIWGGDIKRDYLFIHDATCAYLSLLESDSDHKNRIINFGSGRYVTVTQLAKKICDISGRKTRILVQSKVMRKREVIKQYLSVSRARKLLKWEAKTTLEQGLQETFRWYERSMKQ